MADPITAVSQPAKENLELMNRSTFSFNLKKWLLCAEGQKTVLPEAFLNPGEPLILCSLSDTAVFRNYGKVAGVKSFPALTDEGRIVWISDSSGNFIHGVEYSSEWYGSSLRENGGWSLEMIDIGFPFFITIVSKLVVKKISLLLSIASFKAKLSLSPEILSLIKTRPVSRRKGH